jgi:hypothetical protein
METPMEHYLELHWAMMMGLYLDQMMVMTMELLMGKQKVL